MGSVAQTIGDNTSKDRNTQTDYREGYALIRTVTATDTPISLAPSGWRIPEIASNMFHSNGCKSFNVRLSGGTSGAVPVVHLKSWPYDGAILNAGTGARSSCKGTSIFIATFTLSGSACVNQHPFTGDVNALTSYEASEYSASYEMSGRVKRLTPVAATNRELILQIDAQGDQAFAFEVTDISTANPLYIAVKRVD